VHVVILLATKNGADYLAQQLASLRRQTFSNWSLVVGEDSSTDNTPDILAAFQRVCSPGRVTIVPGPEKKQASANFLNLVARAPTGKAIAFCDQDDVWQDDKLAVAADVLNRVPEGEPALYFCATQICTADLTAIRLSEPPAEPVSFAATLVENVASGNTMVLNAAAASLIHEALRRLSPDQMGVMHDWWVCQVVCGAGGHILFDPVPRVLYRQHVANSIGAGIGLRQSIGRLTRLFDGRARRLVDVHLAALERCSDLFRAENAVMLASFAGARKRRWARRSVALWRVGLFRFRRRGKYAYYVASVLGRI
jgi:glycosyltransferase involved in cell wall biosynthesis